ncbi:MAG TPA: hypothetical protein ENN51_01085 [candidate division WOR-3 bacterium]|uniref:Nucleotidyl transferase AbiEii/AbiGii toxin family protein n=1 Tax=candidate division WOR-3 bacterium TaxID=2052148 RepID=A0A7V0XER9_UNCW3|nr:hypothetical protein [candidate division WOR-3 bacterium]
MHPEVLSDCGRELVGELPVELFEQGFHLAGGTGLALQLGHRRSDDFDFFAATGFDVPGLARRLSELEGYEPASAGRDTLHCRVRGVKLSFISYPVRLRWPTVGFGPVPVADWRDVLAEKFKTVSQRGSRKDFYDIHACCILKRLTPASAVAHLRARFAGTGLNLYHVARSLAWFEDADVEPDPVLLVPAAWDEVKRFFREQLSGFEAALLSP